jgi:hypothetical protein
LKDLTSYHTGEIQDVKFDIEPYISEYSNGIEISTAYNKNLFAADDVAYMMEKYRNLIEFFAMKPDKKLKDWHEKEKKKVVIRKNFSNQGEKRLS